MIDKVILVVCALAPLTFGEVARDANGCRVLSSLPEPGIHPRIFFTADEYPAMRKRLSTPRFKAVFGKIRRQVVSQAFSQYRALADADFARDGVSDDEIVDYLVAGEGRNINWGVASVTAVLDDNGPLKDLMKRVVVNYAHIILASRERSEDSDLAASPKLQKALTVWTHDRFDVGVSWTFGGAGLPLAYDVLYNEMAENQRTTVSRAIAAATKGRKSYGNGMDRGFASSNHYGYHGDLAVMLSAIEGRPGFDQKTWDGIVQVMTDYWEVGYTPLGVSREDGYGPNLGMRAGSRGFLVMARRGYNIFETEKYRKFINYVTQDYDPYPGGHLNGGASGGPYPELYPTSTIVARYMYPENTAANFNYRQLVGENYERRIRWQGWLDYLLYGSDWKGPDNRESMLKGAGLPLSVSYPVRGKFIARSDWSSDAIYLTFDARPDAHLIGHDKVDRGNFSMSALGRVWAFSGDFHQWNTSRENSLVHIDGKAQAWKAPSARMLWNRHGKNVAGAAADLKYAYDWEWTPPWPKWGKSYPAPWEPEKSSASDLGWPRDHLIPEVDGEIHGSATGYAGRNNLHRRPYNRVEKACRSAFLVRGSHPYAMICDDIRKDDEEHHFEWIMQLPGDLTEVGRSRDQIILRESRGDRCLLVRFLQAKACDIRVESYQVHEDRRSGKVTEGQRLVASCEAIEPAFRVLLVPFREGEKLIPVTAWNRDGSLLRVAFGESSHLLRFERRAGATRITLQSP
ncbi:MAG: hypothetical protein CMP30_00295 [Roseibacillus sp.]|nr:hypothetical protein [Roseibacillus sp.]